MKKSLIFAVLAAFATSAMASEPAPRKRPDNLVCTSDSTNTIVQKFHLLGLNTDKLDSDIDARSDGPVSDEFGTTTVVGNNGCDNDYTWIFFSTDLDQLVRGVRKSVTGIMTFANSNSVCADEDCELAETIAISCEIHKI